MPSPLTSFIGRDSERAALAAALGESRLVSLVGPGGIGKTRLAVALGEQLRDRFAAGVVFVPLAAGQSMLNQQHLHTIMVSIEQAGDASFAGGQTAEHKGAMRNGFVAGNADGARKIGRAARRRGPRLNVVRHGQFLCDAVIYAALSLA